MNLLKRMLVLIPLLLVLSIVSNGQTASPAEVDKIKQELADKDITEQEIKDKLKTKGIDLDDIKPNQLPTIEENIQQAILEIEKDKTVASEKGKVEKEAPKVEPKEEIEKPKQKPVVDYNRKDSIYGHHLFYNNSISKYTTVNSTSTPDNYVLDAGDQLAINIFGASQADLLYEIEVDGFVRPAGLYKVYLKGVTFGDAKTMLRKRFSSAYKFQNDQFNVSLTAARTVTVNIYGEVNKPGSYAMSALNNVFGALVLASGPTESGSIRNIKILSNNKERFVDFYDFITNNTVSTNLNLSNGDVIYLPKITKKVSTRGSAFLDGAWTYELKDDENLNDFITIAGGIVDEDLIQYIQLQTREGEMKVVRDYKYEDAVHQNLPLKNNDVVVISKTTFFANNYYSVKGAVRRPGRYELEEGDKVSTAIAKTVLTKETFSEVAYIKRSFTDGSQKLIKVDVAAITDGDALADIKLQERDELTFFLKSIFQDTFSIEVTGAVREPGIFEISSGKTWTVYDLLFLAKGYKDDATQFGFVVSQDITNSSVGGYKIVNLKKAFKDPQSEANILLQPGDKLVVPTTMDYSDDYVVEISGAVRKPSSFKYSKDLKLQQLIVLAGGLKLEAATNRIDIYRLNITDNKPTATLSYTTTINRNIDPLNIGDDFELKPFDHVVIRSAPEFENIRYVSIQGEVKYPGVYAILGNNEKIRSIIERAGGLTEEAFPEGGTIVRTIEGKQEKVVTRMDKALLGNDRDNLVVYSGDLIDLPKTQDIVTIDRLGTNTITDLEADNDTVVDSTNLKLHVQINYKLRRAKWYINEFGGGFSKDAKRAMTKVIYSNGQVKRTRNFGLFKIYPKVRRGSEISLALKDNKELSSDERNEKVTNRRKLIDRVITSTTSLLALTTAAITTLLLTDRL
ncbi:MAG: protein involved in polysaccharide export with SLBB domain [Bacteroidia bacterium]|jgi:protein involved in polysaccharide export with SLBB domain